MTSNRNRSSIRIIRNSTMEDLEKLETAGFEPAKVDNVDALAKLS